MTLFELNDKLLGMNEILTYSKQNPFLAKIKERYSLCKPGSKKLTHHVVLDLRGSGITYKVGDSVAIYPQYDPILVGKTLKASGHSGKELVLDKHTGIAYSLETFLTEKANINEINRKLVTEVARRQTDLQKKEHFEFLLQEGNKEALKEYIENRELWDFLQENQEVRFAAEELAHLLQPMLPRFYSIASSNNSVGEEVHLTVSYVKYTSNGSERLGVCSHYLCDFAPLNQPSIPIYIHPSNGFTLPNENIDIIMIGPGTGIAPYRAFMQERIHTDSSGRNWLFFGEWNRSTDFFYENFWLELEEKGKLKLDLAFSRDQPHKVYVQHRMLEKGAELFDWLEKGAILYVCGDAHRMAKDVDASLHQIIREHGAMDESNAKIYVKKLRAEKRYLRDIY